MPRRNKKKEEVLAQQRDAKKRQYLRIKNDPVLYEEKKQKDKAEYLKRKENKKILSVHELSARDQRLKRKQWRENTRRHRQKLAEEKKKQEMENVIMMGTEESVINLENTKNYTEDPLLSSNSCIQLKTSPEKLLIKRIKYNETKKREKLQKIIHDLRRKNKELRQRIKRLKGRIAKSNNKELVTNLKKQSRKKIFREIKSTRMKTLMVIQKFYEDDLNSRIGSGKKEIITRNKERHQKRYLNDNLKNLYTKFRAENAHLNISYSTFCRNRPFWVVFPKDSDRDTCMCEIHSNMDLLVEALHKANIVKEKNSVEVLTSICCSRYNYECLTRTCALCKNKTLYYREFSNEKEILYYSWKRQNKEYLTADKRKKVCCITTKTATKILPLDAIQKFNDLLPSFFLHCFNIINQYNEIKKLKENLRIHEALLHVDFSENYCIKFAQEVQALHFGGSRSQIALHTAVVYTHNFQTGVVDPMSFCTISDCLRHDASAIWAHLLPLIKLTIEKNPFITKLHFLSDSPSSQYRNKFIFFMISQICNDFPQIECVVWIYSERGHGKGAPDGIGAVIKRTADAAVKFGNDVANLDDFIQILEKRLKTVIIMRVTVQEITIKENDMPTNLKPFRGTLSVHQVLWDKDKEHITFRNLTCFSCDPGEICRHGFHIAFSKNPSRITNKQMEQSDDFVAPLVRTKIFPNERVTTKGSKKYFAEDTMSKSRPSITVLQDITFGAQEMTNFLVSTYLSKPSTSKETMPTTSSHNKENTPDFEDLLEPKIVFKNPKN